MVEEGCPGWGTPPLVFSGRTQTSRLQFRDRDREEDIILDLELSGNPGIDTGGGANLFIRRGRVTDC